MLWTENYKELSIDYLNDKYDEFIETEFDFTSMTKSYWREHSLDIDQCINYWEGKFK